MFFYEVAVPAPLDLLTYQSPQPLALGALHTVPLGKRSTKGVVIKETSKPAFDTVEIGEFLNFVVNSLYLEWLLWIAEHYMYPPGLVVHSIFPPLAEKEPKPSATELAAPHQVELTPAQQTTLKSLLPLNGFKVDLLHGVTGAGKTEIYMELFEEVLKEPGAQGLFLIPEIALTPQLEKRFDLRFPGQISSYHSQLTSRQKTNNWYDFLNGRKRILIGPRSALFCPSPHIKLIVVDEEHESSFKQETKFLYHARDAAIKLAHIKNIPLILGSATPSLESFYNVKQNKVSYVRLKDKVFNQDPPKILIVDMSKQKPEPFWLSKELKSAMESHLAKKKQVALFLNRRGWASYIQCYACGKNFMCPNCDISLTLHNKHKLTCHYCDYGEPAPHICPDCNEDKVHKMGLGTEQVCTHLEEIFPHSRILKFDRDEVQTKNQLKETIRLIEDHEVDIVVGTQMIAKGLDFQNLTLMGILDADQALSFPDFRATEKSLQQISQVMGRVGRRRGLKAEVVLQTRSPKHQIFSHLKEASFENFAQEQLKKRELYHYPPYTRMVALMVQAHTSKQAMLTIAKLAKLCHQLIQAWPKYNEVQILGPSAAPVEKIRNKYRHQLMLKFPLGLAHQPYLKQVLEALGPLPKRAQVTLNVDPVDLM